VSEQEPKNNKQSGEAAESVISAADKSAGKGAPTASGSRHGAAPHRASSAVAWLALLLVFTLAGAAAWVLREGRDREAALAQRVADLETITRQKQTDLDELGDRLQRESRVGLGELKAALASETSRLSQSLESVEAVLAEQRKELARFSASDRNSWLLAEAGHLLRLANQRLVMAGDPVAAQALLNSADAVLREMDDASLHTVRAAVAADIASLRAVPRVDVEGIYLRLAALLEQADTLVIFQLPEQPAQPMPEAAEDWQGRLQQGYVAALAKLSDYLVIRRRDVPMQALMDPQWEGLVRQNLRMLLEQAQVAALSGNQILYTASLDRAQQWLAQFRESDEVTARAMAAEISRLVDLTVNVAQPDISRSLRALDEATRLRLQTVGGQ
jgi:uroporphyrin-III C-methyltransferase